ncbi:MAG: Phage Tail Collar [Parcubacteria group bacterium]|nr:Phage Tail Collar [Parcubacteria group bacterium]
MVEAYKSLPRPIRAFLSDPSFNEMAGLVGTKFNLHIDIQGELVQLVTYILLGFLAPTELKAELTHIGIPEPQVPELIRELNIRIFEPLQKTMKEGDPEEFASDGEQKPIAAATNQPPASTVIPIQAAPAIPMPSVQQIPAPLQSPAPFNAPVTPRPAMSQYVPPAPVDRPAPPPYMPPAPEAFATPIAAPTPFQASVPATEHTAIRTMAQDMQEMKDHPHAAPTMSWQPTSPARSFQTSSVPNTSAQIQNVPLPAPQPFAPAVSSVPAAMPRPAAFSVPVPPNLPGQPAAVPVWKPPVSSVPTAPTIPTSPPMPAAPSAFAPPIIKEYGVDPYRETPG